MRRLTEALNDLPVHYTWPAMDDELERAVLRQTRRSLSDRSGAGIIGEFEAMFANFVKSDYAVAYASGTSAIHAMCLAAGLGPGDSVVAPVYTFPATASPFAFEGVDIAFCDTDEFGNATAATIAAAVRRNTKAVVVTHLWGNPCEMDAIEVFCRDRDLLLLSDCSHAHFATWDGQHVGAWGDMAAFSLNQKAITAGEGGVLTTSNLQLRDRALLAGDYNHRCRKIEDPSLRPLIPTGLGLKQRPHPLALAVAVEQLRRADDIRSRRQANLEILTAACSNSRTLEPMVDRSGRAEPGLYVLPMRTIGNHIPAEVESRAQAMGATMIDAPGSTCIIDSYERFRRVGHVDWNSVGSGGVTDHGGRHPAAFDSWSRSVKTLLWGYAGDEKVVQLYATAIAAL